MCSPHLECPERNMGKLTGMWVPSLGVHVNSTNYATEYAILCEVTMKQQKYLEMSGVQNL